MIIYALFYSATYTSFYSLYMALTGTKTFNVQALINQINNKSAA